MLAICAQWVDKDYILRKALIGLPECRHNHLREHQAELIFDYIQDYGIKHNLGCHTSDNASSNNICVIFFKSDFLGLAFIGTQLETACDA